MENVWSRKAMRVKVVLGAVVTLGLVWVSGTVFSEVIRLKDGTVMTGKILTLFEEGYVVRSLDGDRYVKKGEIDVIQYGDSPSEQPVNAAEEKEPKAGAKATSMPSRAGEVAPVFGRERVYLLDLPYALERQIDPRYSTPQNTFKTWKNAAEVGRIEEMVRCYAEPFQQVIYEHLKNMTEEQVEAMSRETKGTEFKIERIVFKGKMAFARVLRKRDKTLDEDVLNFVKENGSWKLIP